MSDCERKESNMEDALHYYRAYLAAAQQAVTME